MPRQLLVKTKKDANNVTALPHGTSLLDVRAELPAEGDTITLEGLRLYALARLWSQDNTAPSMKVALH